jgi:hypothetical protein
MNLFQITISTIGLITIGLIYLKKGISLLFNFLAGGVILILLSKLDYHDFEGKLDSLSGGIMMLFYVFMNLILFYVFSSNNKRECFFSIPLFTYFIMCICLFILVDYGKYYLFKIGIISRVFLAYFPLYTLLYYKKYKNEE